MTEETRGRPAHKPTEQQRATVMAMVGYGIPEDNIARVVGISAPTLRKHYRDEIDTGKTRAIAKVAESLYKKATSDGPSAVTAAIFFLKTQAGWKETVKQEHTGPDGGPIQTEDVSARERIAGKLAGMSARIDKAEDT